MESVIIYEFVRSQCGINLELLRIEQLLNVVAHLYLLIFGIDIASTPDFKLGCIRYLPSKKLYVWYFTHLKCTSLTKNEKGHSRFECIGLLGKNLRNYVVCATAC